MTGFFETTYILYAAAAPLTPAATRQVGPDFVRYHPLNLSVCVARTSEERDEIPGDVTPFM